MLSSIEMGSKKLNELTRMVKKNYSKVRLPFFLLAKQITKCDNKQLRTMSETYR